MGNKRNGKIDFLKFIFSVIVVVHHSRNVVGTDNLPFLGGAFAVEFFFIVSGYLMMASISRMPETGLPVGVETRNFIIKKYKSFYPEVLVAFVIAGAVTFPFSKRTLVDYLVSSFHEITLLKMIGIGVVRANPPTWYMSSMLLCMLLLFPLIRKKREIMTNMVLPLAILLIFGAFAGNDMSPRGPVDWISITYKGNLRGLAEIGMGICIYPWVEKLKAVKLSKFSRVLLTIVEYGCYIALIDYMRTTKVSQQDYFYLFVYVIAIMISFSEQGIDTKLFRGRIFSWLGKYSFALYLGHYCWSQYLNRLLPEDFSNKERFAVYGLCAILSAMGIMLLSSLIRKLWKYLNAPVKKLLLAKEEQ